MYLKIKFIFYLIGGVVIEEEINYKKKDEAITDEIFRQEVENIETKYREELANALKFKKNNLLFFGDTIFLDDNLLAFKTFIMEDNEDYQLAEDEKQNFGIQPFDFTIEGEDNINED